MVLNVVVNLNSLIPISKKNNYIFEKLCYYQQIYHLINDCPSTILLDGMADLPTARIHKIRPGNVCDKQPDCLGNAKYVIGTILAVDWPFRQRTTSNSVD
ncbi:Hypothetical protein CINCED_3A006238 [Cinara cedri]|uniref:Uncharacterized protein n=1 Tax=Cinara cedri TaxID=506608 RepID=A0A5E4NS73_9HEMI|nr:Hypothetical protein CINCED_3A006238 [Cinara cedri]